MDKYVYSGVIKKHILWESALMKFKSNERYSRVCLTKNKKSKLLSVHRLVAIAFIEAQNNKPYVNHIDGNKYNNRVDNLEWCTAKENTLHAIKNKLLSNDHLKPFNYQKGAIPKNRKTLIDIYTGIFYESIAEATTIYNLDRMTLRKYIDGRWKNKTNLRIA